MIGSAEAGRGWRVLAEASLVVGAVVVGVALVAGGDRTTASWWVDLCVGVVACALLPLRHRWPGPLALALVPADVVSAAGNAAYLVALFALATRGRSRVLALAAVLHVVAALSGTALDGADGSSLVSTAAAVVTVVGAVVAWGLASSDRARTELERARLADRTRVSRDLHDSLANRVSVVALHAGALARAADDDPAAVRRSAEVVSTAARRAMEDLRAIVAALREEGPADPVPGVGDLDELLRQSRSSGLPLEAQLASEALDVVQERDLGTALYRVVQESLTNVLKHAGPVRTSVRVQLAEAGQVVVEVANAAPDPARAPVPAGAGLGIVGLTERLDQVGARLEHGPCGDGYLVRALLPAGPRGTGGTRVSEGTGDSG